MQKKDNLGKERRTKEIIMQFQSSSYLVLCRCSTFFPLTRYSPVLKHAFVLVVSSETFFTA